jgi:hypothetical protein
MAKRVKHNTNSTVDDRERRLEQSCSYCPPNRGENAGRKAKHGAKKSRGKTKKSFGFSAAAERDANRFGFAIIAKPSKPDLSNERIDQLIESSRDEK